jgi:hypothetical protein
MAAPGLEASWEAPPGGEPALLAVDNVTAQGLPAGFAGTKYYWWKLTIEESRILEFQVSNVAVGFDPVDLEDLHTRWPLLHPDQETYAELVAYVNGQGFTEEEYFELLVDLLNTNGPALVGIFFYRDGAFLNGDPSPGVLFGITGQVDDDILPVEPGEEVWVLVTVDSDYGIEADYTLLVDTWDLPMRQIFTVPDFEDVAPGTAFPGPDTTSSLLGFSHDWYEDGGGETVYSCEVTDQESFKGRRSLRGNSHPDPDFGPINSAGIWWGTRVPCIVGAGVLAYGWTKYQEPPNAGSGEFTTDTVDLLFAVTKMGATFFARQFGLYQNSIENTAPAPIQLINGNVFLNPTDPVVYGGGYDGSHWMRWEVEVRVTAVSPLRMEGRVSVSHEDGTLWAELPWTELPPTNFEFDTFFTNSFVVSLFVDCTTYGYWDFPTEDLHASSEQQSYGQLSLVQYRYAPISVNAGYEYGSVETFDYARAMESWTERLTDSGVPIPFNDPRRP